MKRHIVHFNSEVDSNLKPVEGGMLTGSFRLWFKANPDVTKKEIAEMISKSLVKQAEIEASRLKAMDFILMINGREVNE